MTETSYAVRRLWPAVGGAHGVFASQPRETITTHSERAAGDARVQHALVLDVDDYGHPRRSVAIGYPSTAPDARPEQLKLLATLSEVDLSNVVDQPDWYRHGVPLEARTFELAGLPDGTPLTFDQVKPSPTPPSRSRTTHSHRPDRASG